MTTPEIVRVLRVMEYIGPRDWVEATLERGAVPPNGEHILPGNQKIRSAIIGTFPEIFTERMEEERRATNEWRPEQPMTNAPRSVNTPNQTNEQTHDHT